MENYILAIDQGTSSSRAILFNKQGQVVEKHQCEFPQYYPQPGWVEHNADEIWQSQLHTIQSVIKKSGIAPTQINAIGITNQRETTLVWDKNTGQPISPAIVWQDRRTANLCNDLKREGWATKIKEKTGLVIDAYFSATKLSWILNNVEHCRAKAEKGELLFGTIDSWLVWKLSGGKKHLTDYSNASRTMLFNINQGCWDNELLKLFSIPPAMMPEVVPSSGILAYTNEKNIGAEIPIAGIAGDQQAALFGQLCFEKGQVKNTYGTGCFMLMNTGEEKISSDNGLLSTIAWHINGKTTYALEGSVFIAGAAIKWLRDSLKLIGRASETETIALGLPSSEGVYVIPAFAGLGTPYWDMDVKAAILGLTQGSTSSHIIRATLESIAYQTCDVLKVMEKESNISLQSLSVDGGATANNFLMQFQADILQTEVVRPQMLESTAFGAAILAGIATNFWELNQIKSMKNVERLFLPKMNTNQAELLYKGWISAVETIRKK